ncbi:MAG: chemotaxis protein [Rhodoplanes sp.]|uniref:cache domain-containing protein n=1 Tax=Rhodoplanes sp. TaxID=1968906 RepID=UPI0017BA1CAE|nr:cache domain-containing protein [Rhodoplanes sp.]NVO16985.1 chemotaxis protein [Rhodoplanes sp.]
MSTETLTPPSAADAGASTRIAAAWRRAASRRGASWIVALVLGAVLAAMVWLQMHSQDEADSRDRDTRLRLVAGTLNGAFDNAGKFALSLAEATARRPDVVEALAAGDRGRLQVLSQGPYDYLSRQAGVQIYGYHTMDLRYLLRMHRLDAFGDDISGFRPMIVAANRGRRAQTGFEIGIAGLGIRGVALVDRGGASAAPGGGSGNSDRQPVGTMEVGLDVRPILDLVKASTNTDIAVVIAPSMVGVALDPKLPRFGDLVLALSTDDDLFAAMLKTTRPRALRDVEVDTREIEGRRFSMLSQPLVDFSGRQVGMTIALEEMANTRGRLRTELIVTALCGGILAWVVFAVLFRHALAVVHRSRR